MKYRKLQVLEKESDQNGRKENQPLFINGVIGTLRHSAWRWRDMFWQIQEKLFKVCSRHLIEFWILATFYPISPRNVTKPRHHWRKWWVKNCAMLKKFSTGKVASNLRVVCRPCLAGRVEENSIPLKSIRLFTTPSQLSTSVGCESLLNKFSFLVWQ